MTFEEWCKENGYSILKFCGRCACYESVTPVVGNCKKALAAGCPTATIYFIDTCKAWENPEVEPVK